MTVLGKQVKAVFLRLSNKCAILRDLTNDLAKKVLRDCSRRNTMITECYRLGSAVVGEQRVTRPSRGDQSRVEMTQAAWV